VALGISDILFGIPVGSAYRGVPRLYLPTAT
jgi:hypothetical protein